MDVFEDKNKRYRKQLTKLGGNKVLRSRLQAAMFVVRFANLKSRALSRDPSGDRVIPSAEVRVRDQASHGNITVLSHLNRSFLGNGSHAMIAKIYKYQTPHPTTTRRKTIKQRQPTQRLMFTN